jgi:very-short-patch-repair endonuclease
VYCLPGAETAWQTQAVRANAVLSCGAAARHHGLEVFGRVALHLVAAGPRRTARGTAFHRRRVECDGRATTLRQTLLDCCRCLPLAQAVSVLDSALRQGRVEPDELVSLAPASGPHARAVRQAVALTDPQAQSVLESAARVLMVAGGVGSLESQVEVPRVGWVDFVLDGWLVVEVDGYAVHRERFREDRRRDAELVRQGHVVLRFTYEDVERRPAWVLAVVRETLALGRPGHRSARDR